MPTGRPARRATSVPTQSLYLLNSPFMKEQAKLLAAQIMAGSEDDATRLDRLWLRVCGRPPSADERAVARAALGEWLGETPTEKARSEAWARLGHALFGSSAFLFRL